MKPAAWFLMGAVSLVIVQAGTAGILLARAHGWSARQVPTGIESWIARRARDAAIPVDAKARANPLPKTEENLAEARAHWADHCASCHGNDGSGDILMGKRMYPPAPDMRQPATQNLSDGELFFIIRNGIRLTGMPAWGGSDHNAEDSWKLVHFIRHLPNSRLEERKQMEKLNPKSPEELKEEGEEEKFLKGETANEPEPHQHQDH
jgi:mono/diheme cytochrome c family protein